MIWTQKESEIVLNILNTHLPNHTVHAFGSRVHGRNLKKASDLDLVIMTKTPLPSALMADLKEAFSDSDLPYRVDIIDWSQTEPYFQEIILKEKMKIKEGTGYCSQPKSPVDKGLRKPQLLSERLTPPSSSLSSGSS